MTTEDFNALPLEARRFIELNAGCLSCGNSESKLTKAYELYKLHKMTNVYALFGGGINYVVENRNGVLYNVKDGDSDFEIREKLALAEAIYAKNPEVFISYDQRAIDDLRDSLGEVPVVDLRTPVKPEEIAWAKRSKALGIDTKIADWDEIQKYIADNNLNPSGKKKVDFIAAIDAIEVTEVTEDLI